MEKESSLVQMNVLGVRIASLHLSDLMNWAVTFATDGQRHKVMYANVHVLNMAYRDPELRRILNTADLVYCDGSGVAWGARLLGHRLPERMTGADWVYQACARWRDRSRALFFLGGQPGVAEVAAAKLQHAVPGLQVVGACSGFFADSLQVVDLINAADPDIVIVGMGTPVQERWIAENFHRLTARLVWAVGGLMDIVSGRLARPPQWMSDMGFEWLGRLLINPRRLWARYLIGNPLFLWRVIRQRFGQL